MVYQNLVNVDGRLKKDKLYFFKTIIYFYFETITIILRDLIFSSVMSELIIAAPFFLHFRLFLGILRFRGISSSFYFKGYLVNNSILRGALPVLQAFFY